jgi:hypothetical protein
VEDLERDKVGHDLDVLKVARVALLSVAAMFGVLVIAVSIIAAIHGRTRGPDRSGQLPALLDGG